LVNEGGHSRKKEERAQQEVLPFLLAPIKVEGRYDKKKQVEKKEEQNRTGDHDPPESGCDGSIEEDYDNVRAA